MVATTEQLQQPASQQSANSDRVAVLLMGYGEVESYADFANYNEQALNLLTAKFAPIPTWLYPPLARLLALFDRHEWSHQHGNFISPHNAIFERQRVGIEQHLQAQWGMSDAVPGEPRVKVFKAFNFCAPFLPEQVLAEIKAEGFDKLLIYPLLVVDSIFTSGIAVEQANKALVRHRDGSEHWLTGTRYIPSFFDEPEYIELQARLVHEKITTELAAAHLPSQTGIVLMNHGCPHKAKGFTSGIRESEILYEQVREKLIHRYPLISVGWLNHDTPLIEWTQPDAKLAARNLIELGATTIVFVPIGFATENHETLLDVDHIMHALRYLRPDVTYIQMPCVNDHPDFLRMAADWANPHLAELLTEQALVVDPRLATERPQPSHTHTHHHHDFSGNHHKHDH